MATKFSDFILGGGIDPNPPFDFTTGPWRPFPYDESDGDRVWCIDPPTTEDNRKTSSTWIDSTFPTSRAWLRQFNPDGNYFTLVDVTGSGYLLWLWGCDTNGGTARFRVTIDGVLKNLGGITPSSALGDVVFGQNGPTINRQRDQTPSANMDEHTKLYCTESADKFGLRFNSSAKIEVSGTSIGGYLHAAADYFFDGEI